MIEVKHGIIRASAGSGKTWQLARRFIRLLALKVPPEKIAALTFTRKAAGEFFDRILRQLAELAKEPDKSGEYLDELKGASRDYLVGLLRSVIARMDRLRLGTLDSFFASMVRCLPFDFGLAGIGALLSEDEETEAREDVLDALLREALRPENDVIRRELLEAWKRASYGRESGSPLRDIDPLLKGVHPLYLANPAMECWGDPAVIWTDRKDAVWKDGADFDKAKANVELLRTAAGRFTPKAREYWEEFFKLFELHIAGESGFGKSRLKYMLEAGRRPEEHRANPSALKSGLAWKMGSGRAVPLSAIEGRALHEMLSIIVGRELKCRCDRIAGRRDLLALYEAMYHRRVRGQGRLVFADLSLLLAGKLGVARKLEWKPLRLALEYRLDSIYDHWLFDEFQDTSFAQWGVFENLIAEVLQDPSGRRSVFAVGDTKQSIYLWREAEPELFRQVEASLPKERTQLEPLNKSYRSCPAVLQMVNAMFAGTPRLEAEFPGIEKFWQWLPHESEGDAAKQSGHAALIAVDPVEQEGEGKAADAAMAALIKQADPLQRGLTCAVIVRSNKEAARLGVRLRHLLREQQMEVLCESEEAVATDNPVTLALLSVFRIAAHPGDRAAWMHLMMTPLSEPLQKEKTTPANLGTQVRAELVRGGFFGVATKWLEWIREANHGLDEFSERRAAQFLELAAEVDATGSRDLDAFIRLARRHRRREDGTARAIQVMTVHKSKGLEFDMVILGELGTKAMDRNRDLLLTSRGERGTAQWYLERPPTTVSEWDGRLMEVIRQAEARAAFEGLCRVYVAMTRAKRALHIFLPARLEARSESQVVKSMLVENDSPPAESRTIEGVLTNVLREWGDAHWFKDATSPPAAARGEAPPVSPVTPLAKLLQAVNLPVQRRTPSGSERMRITGAELLSPQRESSRGFGTLVHRLFAEIEWIEDLDDTALETKWRNAGLAAMEGFERAKEMVRQNLARDELRSWFTNIGGARQAWRERSFDLMADREWISGQIDRVILERDGKGRFTAATILDFKTDNVSSESDMKEKIEGYAPQVTLYRTAVARLTGLPAKSVRAALIFTTQKEWRWVSDAKA